MRKIILIVFGLLILSGVLLFLSKKKSSPSNEASDVVITIEKTPPSTESSTETLPSVTSGQENSPDPVPKDEESEEYAEELQVTLASLPRIEDLQALPQKDVHHTPVALRESGDKIAAIIAQAESTPKLRQETMNFLLSCAESKDSAKSIRALCWNKLIKNIPRWKIFLPLTSADVSQEVKDLASRL